MEEKKYTIHELAELTGTEPRTIRSYVQQGLLRGPGSAGRYAHYGYGDLVRLKAIRVMKDMEGLKMTDIRMNLLNFSEAQVLEISNRYDVHAETAKASPPAGSSALEYLSAIKSALGGEWTGKNIGMTGKTAPVPPRMVTSSTASEMIRPMQDSKVCDIKTAPEDKSSMDELLVKLGNIYPQWSPKRKSRGESWVRIPITPDLELGVRGTRSPEELAKLEHLADLIREILVGGVKYEK